jgi:pimeloyl-ACP methyl ester carboxylesterase
VIGHSNGGVYMQSLIASYPERVGKIVFSHSLTSMRKEDATDVLIMDSTTDTLANPMQRAEMLRLCPGASEYRFKSGGHLTMVNCRDEYMCVLKRFLKGCAPL